MATARDPQRNNEEARLLEAVEEHFGVWRDRWIEDRRIALANPLSFSWLCEEFCRDIDATGSFPLDGILMLGHEDSIFEFERPVGAGDAYLQLHWRNEQVDAEDWKVKTERQEPITAEFLEESKAVRQFFLVWNAKGQDATQSTHFASNKVVYPEIKRLFLSFARDWDVGGETLREKLSRIPVLFPNLETLCIENLPTFIFFASEGEKLRHALCDFVREANFCSPCKLWIVAHVDFNWGPRNDTEALSENDEFFYGRLNIASNLYTNLLENSSWSSFEFCSHDKNYLYYHPIFESALIVQESDIHDASGNLNCQRANTLYSYEIGYKKHTTKETLERLQLNKIVLDLHFSVPRENCRKLILATLLPSSQDGEDGERNGFPYLEKFVVVNRFLDEEELDLYQFGHSIGSSDECKWNMRNLMTMLDKVNTILIFKLDEITQDNRDFIFGLMQANPGCWIPYLTGKNARNNLDNSDAGRKRKRDES